MAITDHGAMFGAIDFYKACKANDIKPIIGCEVYVAPRNRKDKDPNLDAKYNHLILLAKDNQGYKNLATLVSLGYTEGFYYKPRIDHELLMSLNPNDFIITSACVAGILNNEELVKELSEKFKKHFFLEVQNHNEDVQKEWNKKALYLKKKYNINGDYKKMLPKEEKIPKQLNLL